jgi:hypothetical protein
MSDLEAIADALWIAKSWLLTGSLQPTQGGSYRIHGDVLAVENYWFGHPNAGKVSPWPIDGEQVVHTRRKFTVPLMPDEPVSASATPPERSVEDAMQTLASRLIHADQRTRDAVGELLLRYAQAPESGANLVRAIEALLGGSDEGDSAVR